MMDLLQANTLCLQLLAFSAVLSTPLMLCCASCSSGASLIYVSPLAMQLYHNVPTLAYDYQPTL